MRGDLLRLIGGISCRGWHRSWRRAGFRPDEGARPIPRDLCVVVGGLRERLSSELAPKERAGGARLAHLLDERGILGPARRRTSREFTAAAISTVQV